MGIPSRVRPLIAPTRKIVGPTASRAARFLDRVAGPAAATRVRSNAGEFPPRPALPLPDGQTRQSLLDMFRSLQIDDSPHGELDTYASVDCERFIRTLDLIPTKTRSALEIGANPYFTTLLIKEFRDLDLLMTNYFGPGDQDQVQHVKYRRPDGTNVDTEFKFSNTNVESDSLPYPDESLDTVLFCEVMEHMTNDPLHVMTEISRVLQPNGHLVLTTPNVARLENVATLLAGANMYDPYSGYGPYGRHNREYTAHELNWLLRYCGFEIERRYTADVSPSTANGFFPVARFRQLVEYREADLGHYHFMLAKKVRSPKNLKRPEWLYRSYPPGELLSLSLADEPPISG